MNNYLSTSILILLASSLFSVSTISAAPEYYSITYALPYDFSDYSQFTADSYATHQWLSAVQVGLRSRSIDHDRSYDYELAASMSITGSVVTFVLKDNLKFSDGSDLDAYDVKFTYTSLLSPAINRVSYPILSNYFSSNDSIKVIDSKTLTFTLSSKYAFADHLFSIGIQPEEHFSSRLLTEDYDWNSPDLSDAISAGPFKISSFDSVNNEITVIKNYNYWNADNVRLDQIVFKKVTEKSQAIANLKEGLIDIFDSQYVAGKSELSDVDNIVEDFVVAPAHQEVSFNHLHPYFGTGELLNISNKIQGANNIRKAISHIINRDYCANDILEGLAIPAATVVPPVSIGWDNSITYREYSIDKAMEYMELAGFDYTILTKDEDGDYTSFFFNITVMSPNSVRNSQWSALIAETLPKIGIEVSSHQSVGWETIGPRTWDRDTPPPQFSEGGFDIMFVGYGWDLDFDPTGLYDSEAIVPNGDNFYNFNNSEYNALLQSYTTAMDLEDRIEAFKALQQFIFDWEIVAPILHPLDHFAYYEGISGLDPILLSVGNCEWDKISTTRADNVVIDENNPWNIPFEFTFGFLGIVSIVFIRRRDIHNF
ncbi:MAG: ABC transporter substrate-binding protein [Candidatus Heimdallarchaeota archaeon]|nr:ABC transporter substrate-binding protein [Candidatus Heimdallarchaeota archaeon]